MASSPLAQIDWDNLGSADLPLAVSLLATATQERFSIGTVGRSGRMRTGWGGFDISDRDIFPYKTNDPEWTLNAGDPLSDFTSQVSLLLGGIIRVFADTEKWDTAATNKETTTTVYLLNGVADDPFTYDNRLLEITGYTSYPDLSLYTSEEVKKWYDMIAVCTTVFRRSGIETDDYLIFNGQYDTEAEGAYSVNADGAEYFGGDPTLFIGEPTSDNTVYDSFKTGNSGLFATLPTEFNESTDTGTYPPEQPRTERVYDMRAWVRSGGTGDGTYFSWVRAWQITYVADWSKSMAAIGFTGRPLSYKNQSKASHSIFTNSAFTPVYTFPSSTTADNQRYYTTNTVTQVGSRDEIAVDHLLNPVTTPVNIGAFSKGDVIEADISLYAGPFQADFGADQFLENWNGEGGFDSYTP